jgi:fibronectin type 3 domain-containing protein
VTAVMRKTLFVLLLFTLCSLSVHAQATKHTVQLNWTLTQTPGVTITDVNVYRGTTSGGPYIAIGHTGSGTVTSFTDLNVSGGTTYYYVVDAVAGTEQSADSNQATAVIPQGPQSPQALTAIVK